MEKINRALMGVEDNAEAIRSLRTKVTSDAKAVNALRTEVNDNAEAVDALRTDVSDNAEAVDALRTEVMNNAAAIEALNDKTNIIVTTSQAITGTATMGTFGTYEFSGPSVVIMEGDGKTARELLINRVSFAKGTFPIVFGIDRSSIFEFCIRPPSKDTYLILIGHVKKKE